MKFDRASAEDLVTKVVQPYTDAYLIAKQCQYASTSNTAEVNALLHWLNRIDNSDWLPSAMKFLADKASDAAYVRWFFRKLERLAAVLHVCAYDVNSRIERYASVLRALEAPHSIASPVAEVELKSYEKDAMRRALDGDIYGMTARRRNYLILRLDSFLSDGAASYDPTLLTIEHVLPQTVAEGSQWATWWPSKAEQVAWVNRLANLVPLNRRRNSAARNYDFETKKKAYFGGRSGVSSYILTTQVLSAQEWTPAVVQARQADLLGLLKEKWELV